MCKSLTKSRRFSKSVGTPERILFAEIFRFLNLLFETSFFKIPERAETVRNFPEPNWKTGKAVLKQPIFFDDFWREMIARIGQKRQETEKLNFFWFYSFCFWVFDCYRHVIFEKKFMSFQVHLEEGSNKFWCVARSSMALNDPKYPKQIEAQTTFLLCFFHFLRQKCFLGQREFRKSRGWKKFFYLVFRIFRVPGREI